MKVDKQTLDDLNIPGKFRPGSIFSLFNQVKTAGGERLLDEWFRHPLTNIAAITERAAIFQYFQQKQLQFPFQREQFAVVENYLSGYGGNIMVKKLMATVLRDEQYALLHKGLLATIDALNTLKEFVREIDLPIVPQLNLPTLPTKTLLDVSRSNKLLRSTHRDELEQILNFIYQLDIFIAVTDVARERNFSYATLSTNAHLTATALWHPAVPNAIPNAIHFDQDKNLLFLTGANMAGKSTFMKAVGIAVFLAHLGFPVAAENMHCNLLDGLFTSINVSDNLNSGYSHFYAEVLRVKNVAIAVSGQKKLLVIFDELFKGTNVKDAYDATVQVTAAFAKYRDCHFIISTHIIEAGDSLKSTHSNIHFAYLPTIMEAHIPRYTYRLTEGITSDRQGMIIIENEKILDIIHES